MEISEVKVYPLRDQSGRVLCVASILVDGVVRLNEIKLIRMNGRPDRIFFPAHRRRVRCVACRGWIDFNMRYCPECGEKQPSSQVHRSDNFRELYHTISRETRDQIRDAVIIAYEVEIKKLENETNHRPNGGVTPIVEHDQPSRTNPGEIP